MAAGAGRFEEFAVTAEERREDGWTVIVLQGAFDSAEARRILEVVLGLPPRSKVRVDFHEAERVDEYAFASFVGEVTPDRCPAIELIGLSRHLERLLRYMGANPSLH